MTSPVDDDLLDLYEHAPFGHVSTTTDWVVVRVNETFAELVGHTPDALVGTALSDLFAPGSRIFHETHYVPLLTAQGRVEEVTSDLVCADGSRLPVLMASQLVTRDGEHPDVVRTAFVVARQRRRYEAETQRQRRRAEASEARMALLHQVVAALAASVDVDDVTGVVDDQLGEAADAKTGIWVHADLGGLKRLSAPGRKGSAPAPTPPHGIVDEAWRSGGPVVAATAGLAAVPLGEAVSPGGVLVVALDRIIPDELLDEASDEAVQGVPDLLRTLGREIGQALQRARLHQRRAWLLGVAAHDLRTPMTSIVGFANSLERLLGDRLEGDELRLLERIAAVGHDMAALIDDVVQMSELEAGELEVDRQPVDLAELADDAIEAHRDAALDKRITIRRDGDDVGLVPIDARRFRQVLDNLLSNAVKYSPKDTEVGVRIEADASEVRLEVTDQGQGIPEQEIDQVFEPFRRTSAEPTGGETSTGLGLSIARQIVRAHGGDISVTSELGEGSTFTLRLPRPAGTGA